MLVALSSHHEDHLKCAWVAENRQMPWHLGDCGVAERSQFEKRGEAERQQSA